MLFVHMQLCSTRAVRKSLDKFWIPTKWRTVLAKGLMITGLLQPWSFLGKLSNNRRGHLACDHNTHTATKIPFTYSQKRNCRIGRPWEYLFQIFGIIRISKFASPLSFNQGNPTRTVYSWCIKKIYKYWFQLNSNSFYFISIHES
jgi:hypothetical protein